MVGGRCRRSTFRLFIPIRFETDDRKIWRLTYVVITKLLRWEGYDESKLLRIILKITINCLSSNDLLIHCWPLLLSVSDIDVPVSKSKHGLMNTYNGKEFQCSVRVHKIWVYMRYNMLVYSVLNNNYEYLKSLTLF